jgi:hypothetical protein
MRAWSTRAVTYTVLVDDDLLARAARHLHEAASIVAEIGTTADVERRTDLWLRFGVLLHVVDTLLPDDPHEI